MSPLVRPLGRRGSLGYWRLGRILARPFDVPPEPMAGGMDAGFFQARHRNVIPHEYPCRRVFAERFRDRRPSPDVIWEARGWRFPFDADRVDLSAFWHRPTRVETRARTMLRTEGGRLTLRLATCGAAMLWIDGHEVGWLAPYRRNLESSVTLTVDLDAGDHEVEVWAGELCERDTRFGFGLEAAGAYAILLPVPVAPSRVDALERLLQGIRFDRPAYTGGTATIRLAEPVPHALDAEIEVEGSFTAPERLTFTRGLAPGDRELPVADAAVLPADFRLYRVRLTDGPMTLERQLGVETIDASVQGSAPAARTARADEALAHVAGNPRTGPMGALARLAIGRVGDQTERMLLAALPPIERCDDCADFLLVPLLWARIRHGDALDPAVRAAIDRTVLGFRYWLDEPGDDVMWFFSENHALLFHTACYLAGGLLPDRCFARSGRSGAEQRAVGRKRLIGWLEHFARCELAEWNSAAYLPINLKGLCALHALGDDEIRRRAGDAIHRLLTILARCCHQGLITTSQGRSYEHSLRAARTLEVSAIARMLWGRGWYGDQAHALPLLALSIRDHALEPPESLREIAFWRRPGHCEWCCAQGEGGAARLYHYKASDFGLGTAAAYGTGGWGYQETILHARIGDHPDAQLWINHPGEPHVGGTGRPSFWGGNGTLPRVHQYRALAMAAFDARPDTPAFTHAYLPLAVFDEVRLEERRILVRHGRGLALLQAGAPMRPVEHGPAAGIEQRLDGRRGRWLLRLSDLDREGSLHAFASRMAELDIVERGETLEVVDPDYGIVSGHAAGIVRAEGRTLDPRSWTLAGRCVELKPAR